MFQEADQITQQSVPTTLSQSGFRRRIRHLSNPAQQLSANQKNSLEGPLPNAFQELVNLKALDFSGNKLSECGMGGPISPLWDVYSFGILLLEMFTGRRPTDENFVGGLNLHEFVKTSFPEKIMEVVDPNLLLDTNGDQMKKTIRECLEDVMELALICSKRLPSERMPMGNVSKRLDIIVDVFSDLERVRK